jgi:hypothetical protein
MNIIKLYSQAKNILHNFHEYVSSSVSLVSATLENLLGGATNKNEKRIFYYDFRRKNKK